MAPLDGGNLIVVFTKNGLGDAENMWRLVRVCQKGEDLIVVLVNQLLQLFFGDADGGLNDFVRCVFDLRTVLGKDVGDGGLELSRGGRSRIQMELGDGVVVWFCDLVFLPFREDVH